MLVEMVDGDPRKVLPGGVLVITHDDEPVEVTEELTVCKGAALLLGNHAELSIDGGTLKVEAGGRLIFFPASCCTAAWGTLQLDGQSYGGPEMEAALETARFADPEEAWIAVAETLANGQPRNGHRLRLFEDESFEQLRDLVEFALP